MRAETQPQLQTLLLTLLPGDHSTVGNASLLQKEGMAGQVQMIYIDPPYGIKYGSNFQPFTNKRDVKDRSDADLTQEPEMIKAFRDTWELAITLAKQRLMTASYDYFSLRYPHEGLKGGFIYKTVPHVTLKSIANNPEIDAIYERLHPGIDAALAELNAALAANPPTAPFTITEGARKGQVVKWGSDPNSGQDSRGTQPATTDLGSDPHLAGRTKAATSSGTALLEWEVPFDLPEAWPAEAQTQFQAFHTARQKMQAEMDRSIAAQADNETLYDQPEKTKNKLRVSGPFTVEAVPFPTVLSLQEHSAHAPLAETANFAANSALADMSVARSGNTSRQHTWRDELLKAGIRGKGGQMLKFAELEVLPGTACLHASGHLDTGERVVISFGPEHGALEQRQVEHALGEAADLFPRPKMIVFCAFAFDPEAAKDIDALKGITALKAQMNTDLLTEDLKKASSKATTNQSFWLMGQPDVHLTALPGGLWQVEVNGFDYLTPPRANWCPAAKPKLPPGAWTPTTTGAACSRTSSSSLWRARKRAG
jgi:adenine-specific DNA-methyltransferase